MNDTPISSIKINNRIRKNLGDIQSLANSIDDLGLLHPIVLNSKNELVCGYRRLEAYKLLGWQSIPATIAYNLDDVLLALKAERDENVHHKEFLPSEAYNAAMAIDPLEREAAKDRQGTRTDIQHCGKLPQSGRSRDKVAQSLGISGKTYQKIKKIIEFAESNPDYQYIVDETDETGKVDRGYKELQRVQKLIARQNSKTDIPEDNDVWHGDFRVVGQRIPDNSVDLIFTDPPYNENAIELYRDLGIFAERVLKPGGLCLAYSGQIFLPQVLNVLSKSLEYVWCFAVKHNGAYTRIFKPKVNNAWKPILMFCKPPYEVWWKQIVDLIEDNMDKHDHDWQQSTNAPDYYLDKLCPSKGLVVDPFCGSGTTLVSAKKIGLNYVGIEDDESDIITSVRRLSDC